MRVVHLGRSTCHAMSGPLSLTASEETLQQSASSEQPVGPFDERSAANRTSKQHIPFETKHCTSRDTRLSPTLITPQQEDYNTYRANPWSPFPLRRAHPEPGPHTILLRHPGSVWYLAEPLLNDCVQNVEWVPTVLWLSLSLVAPASAGVFSRGVKTVGLGAGCRVYNVGCIA